MPRHRSNQLPRADTTTYKDLRSHRRLHNRQSKQSAKYYGYRGVHPSWVDQPYLAFSQNQHNPYWTCADPLLSGLEAQVSTWTKRDMYLERESNIWPLDRRHHVGKHIRERRSRKWDDLALGRRMKQRHGEWEFAVDDAKSLATWMHDEIETVYWELEERDWDDVEEIYDAEGLSPPARMDLDGERFLDEWFEDCGLLDEQIVGGGNDAGAEGDFVCLEGIEDEVDGFLLIFEDTADDDVSVWSMEDGFEMVEAG